MIKIKEETKIEKVDEQHSGIISIDENKFSLIEISNISKEIKDNMKYKPIIVKNSQYSEIIDPIKFSLLNRQINEDEEFIITDNNRRTSHILSKPEFCELISIRSNQIANGAEPTIDIEEKGFDNAQDIARDELRQRKFPLKIKRPINDTKSELWSPNEMIIPNY